jgi:hypothetical protein
MPTGGTVGYIGVVCVTPAIGKKQESVWGVRPLCKDRDTRNTKNVNFVDSRHSK